MASFDESCSQPADTARSPQATALFGLKARLMRSTWKDHYEWGLGYRMMPVVKALLIANVIVFIVQQTFLHFTTLDAVGQNMFDMLFSLSTLGVRSGMLWQFLTYMFLHVDPWHLMFNMLGLYFLGNEVEATLGAKRFLQIYLLGGIFAGIAWYLSIWGKPLVGLQGASGAVFAIVAAFAALYPNRPITLLVFFVLPWTILAKYMALLYVVTSVVFMVYDSGEVAHVAHLAGLGVGFFYIKAFTSNSWWFRVKWLNKVKPVIHSVRKVEAIRSPLKRDEFMKKRIDPILDKIAEHGIHSLTKEERKLLDEAKDRLN